MKNELEMKKKLFTEQYIKEFDKYKPKEGELQEFEDFLKKEKNNIIDVNKEWDYEKNVRYYCFRGGHWIGAVFWYSERLGLEVPKNNYDINNMRIFH